MEKRTRTRLVEIEKEYYVSTDGTEFETAEQCMEYENTHKESKKHPRINMAFYDDNLDYVREAAYQNRMSITEYVNKLIENDKQGKKGHKAPRINMAFGPENYKWIKTRSRQIGISATEFVNTILERERLKNK